MNLPVVAIAWGSTKQNVGEEKPEVRELPIRFRVCVTRRDCDCTETCLWGWLWVHHFADTPESTHGILIKPLGPHDNSRDYAYSPRTIIISHTAPGSAAFRFFKSFSGNNILLPTP